MREELRVLRRLKWKNRFGGIMHNVGKFFVKLAEMLYKAGFKRTGERLLDWTWNNISIPAFRIIDEVEEALIAMGATRYGKS